MAEKKAATKKTAAKKTETKEYVAPKAEEFPKRRKSFHPSESRHRRDLNG